MDSLQTIGQRIAAGRRALGLSQEALGAQLGVSRQAIYKWEQDAALPEIDKLITLSRLFGVSVGTLLGVEEPAEAPPSGDLTDAQLRAVEEIADRYIQAQPKRRRWPAILAAIVAAALTIALVKVADELNTVRFEYQNLQQSMSGLSSSVSSQISGISGRVEDILKAQNSLLSDYGAELREVNPAENTATFALWAVPKTWEEGLSLRFTAQSGDSLTEERRADSEDGRFEATLTCPLSDSIDLNVVLERGGVLQHQKLQSYGGLFSQTLPTLQVFTHIEGLDGFSGPFTAEPRHYASVKFQESGSTVSATHAGVDAAEIASIRVGLFRNRTLICWAEPCETPENFFGFDGHSFYDFGEITLPELSIGDIVEVAALVTDTYGRRFMAEDIGFAVARLEPDGACYFDYPEMFSTQPDPAQWDF